MSPLPQLVVVCRRPGLIRAGRSWRSYSCHSLDDFSVEELTELAEEPEIILVVGTLMTVDNVAELKAQVAELAVEATKAAEPGRKNVQKTI